jgi:hypothetical protein
MTNAAFEQAGDRTGRLPETLDLDFQKFFDGFNAVAASPKASVNASAK